MQDFCMQTLDDDAVQVFIGTKISVCRCWGPHAVTFVELLLR